MTARPPRVVGNRVTTRVGGALPWQGSARNGLPERSGNYVHPGWTNGKPSAADNPEPGCCAGCGHPTTSSSHRIRCLGKTPAEERQRQELAHGSHELCGTMEGWWLHQRLQQAACQACLAAWALSKRLEQAIGNPTKCQACGYKLNSKRCAGVCGPGGGRALRRSPSR